jgi:hypothetical protein
VGAMALPAQLLTGNPYHNLRKRGTTPKPHCFLSSNIKVKKLQNRGIDKGWRQVDGNHTMVRLRIKGDLATTGRITSRRLHECKSTRKLTQGTHHCFVCF